MGPSEPDQSVLLLEQARGKADLAGFVLLLVGLVSLLLPGLFVLRSVQLGVMTDEQYQAQIDEAKPMLDKLFPNGVPGPIPTKNQTLGYFAAFGVGTLAVSLFVVLAGLRMRQLKSYALSVAGALMAMVPCVSCVGTCGLGQVAGLWAMIVLTDPYVRAAFESNAPQQGGTP